MFEAAICDPNVTSRTPDSHAGWMHICAQSKWDRAEIPRCRGNVRCRNCKSKGQTRDADVLDILSIDQVYLLSSLDLDSVWIAISGQAQIKAPAVSLFLEPEFAVGIVEVL